MRPSVLLSNRSNRIKFMGSDVLSHAKCDIMTGVIREILFRSFRARAVHATEGAWEQRRNETKARVRDDT